MKLQICDLILAVLRIGPMTTREISGTINHAPEEVSEHLLTLKFLGQINHLAGVGDPLWALNASRKPITNSPRQTATDSHSFNSFKPMLPSNAKEWRSWLPMIQEIEIDKKLKAVAYRKKKKNH